MFTTILPLPIDGMGAILSIAGHWQSRNKSCSNCLPVTAGFPQPSKNKVVQNIILNYVPTALATLIEPIWLMINRVGCQLQQLEELRRGAAPSKRSIDLSYGSFPPQLALFKALRSRHLLLAAVCSMTLLANILAVAFADLFDQDLRYLSTTTEYEIVIQDRFVAINGSVGPGLSSVEASEPSGAWKGGDGNDQFLVAESNITGGTPLPPWTDHQMMYLPFKTGTRDGEYYKARTRAFGSTLECQPLISGVNYTAVLGTTYDSNDNPTYPELTVNTTALTSSGEKATCFGSTQIYPFIITRERDAPGCEQGDFAAEVILALHARANATQQEMDACAGTVALGWTRRSNGTCQIMQQATLDSRDTLFVGCVQKIAIGDATVLVDSKGYLQQPASDLELLGSDDSENLQRHFTNSASELIKQSSLFLFGENPTPKFHDDTYATHPINYFIRARNGSKALDPNEPPPTFSEMQEPLESVYRYLFSLWLGTNMDSLFVANTEDQSRIPGWVMRPAERVFLSTPMFIIAESILGCYAIVALLVYVRRPGQYLTRLPTTIGAMIAMFAASAAVRDMQGTSTHSSKERSNHLKKLGHKYGYGSYIGADGKVHVGIEKVPLVTVKGTSSW